MKNKELKALFVTAAVLGAIGFTATVSAHESGARSLGYADGATDYYQVSCFDDGSGAPAYLEVELQDLLPKPAPNPTISIQIIKGIKAGNATDHTDGDTTYSKPMRVYGGPGTYFVTVDKNNINKENYQFNYHCLTATNVHTGTSEPLPVAQNQ